MSHELSIIGAGVMAEAIARGVLAAKTLSPQAIMAADVSAQRREFFQSELGIKAVEKASNAVDAKIALLCVKPYQMEAVLSEISGAIRDQSLIISIAAGIGTQWIEQSLGTGNWRVIRAMPNTPMLVGCGMVAIAPGSHAMTTDISAAKGLFETGAKVLEVSEEKMDAVTAISGSGPAYFFFLVEQMIQAGVELGLSAAEARTLAIQTIAGAAKMMSQSSDLPQELRRRVTTPNGTTHAAISHMESRQWPGITIEALKSAARRSAEMGK